MVRYHSLTGCQAIRPARYGLLPISSIFSFTPRISNSVKLALKGPNLSDFSSSRILCRSERERVRTLRGVRTPSGGGEPGGPGPRGVDAAGWAACHRAPGAGEYERQANWHMTEGGSPLERRSNRTTFLREPCDGTREGAGEASVAVRAGRAMERRKRTTSGVPRPCTRSKATPVGPEKVRIDRTPRRRRTHARTYVIYRDLGGLRVVPAGCRRGRGGKA